MPKLLIKACATFNIDKIYSFVEGATLFNPIFITFNFTTRKNFLFIDDSVKKLKSAAKSNIKGILFKDNEQIREELRKYFG